MQHLTPEPTRAKISSHLLTLVRKDLIGPDNSAFAGDDAFRFRNMVVRDAAYGAMPKQARADLHERYGEWLERTTQHSPEYDPIVAHHFEQARRYLAELGPLDAHARALGDRAAELYAASAERAFDRGEVRAAAALLERSVASSAQEDERRHARLVQLGAAVRDSGDLTRAEELLREALTSGEASTVAHARLELTLTKILKDPEGKAEEALRVAEELIRTFEAAHDEIGLSKAWRLLAFRHWVLAEAGGAEIALEHALEHARKSGRRGDELEFLGGIPFAVRYGPLPLDEAATRIHACREEAGDSLTVELSVEGALAGIAAARGRFDEARTRAARAQELYAELGRDLDAAVASQTGGYIERQAGDLAAAEAILRDGCERLQAFGERGGFATTALMLGDVLYARGALEEAEAWGDAGAEAASSDDVAAQAQTRALRAKLAARQGEHERAEALGAEAVELLLTTDFLESQADALTDLADVYELAGRADDAAAALRRALELYDRKGVSVSADECARSSPRSRPSDYGAVAVVVTVVVTVAVESTVVVATLTLVEIDGVVEPVEPVGPFETFTRTAAPRATCCPLAGSWAITVPAASGAATLITRALNPAFASAAVAFWSESPRSAGTATRFEPFDTRSSTSVPCAACWPAAGCWETTTPAALSDATSCVRTFRCSESASCFAAVSFSPASCGIFACERPLETTIAMKEFFSSLAPALGAWSSTVPGAVDATRAIGLTRKFRAAAASSACCRFSPTRSGTRRVVVPLSRCVSQRTRKRIASAPSSPASTHGQTSPRGGASSTTTRRPGGYGPSVVSTNVSSSGPAGGGGGCATRATFRGATCANLRCDRDGATRTRGLRLPKATLYQAELRPASESVGRR